MTAVAPYTPSTLHPQHLQNAPEAAARTRRMGFSMIEVMGAVLLTSIVISIAVSFQINLGSATQNARERLRSQRQAVALLDRMSRDIAGTYFIAPRITNGAPESTPWIFLTIQDFLDEGLASDSSNAIKFVTRNYVPQDIDGHSSDLAVVAYYVEPQEDRPGYQLMRYRSTHMPLVYDPSFPQADAPNTDVIGEDIASFKIRVINQTGGVDSKWSSIRKRGSVALPLGVKLEISMLTTDEIIATELDEDFEIPIERDEEDEEEDGDRKTFAKTVMLPLRPLDWSFLEEIDNVEKTPIDDEEDPDEEDDEDDEDHEDDEDDEDHEDDEDDEDEL